MELSCASISPVGLLQLDSSALKKIPEDDPRNHINIYIPHLPTLYCSSPSLRYSRPRPMTMVTPSFAYFPSKKKNRKTKYLWRKIRSVVTRGRCWGGDIGWWWSNVQISSYKIGKYWRHNVQHDYNNIYIYTYIYSCNLYKNWSKY